MMMHFLFVQYVGMRLNALGALRAMGSDRMGSDRMVCCMPAQRCSHLNLFQPSPVHTKTKTRVTIVIISQFA
jgi:hypothetical protein